MTTKRRNRRPVDSTGKPAPYQTVRERIREHTARKRAAAEQAASLARAAQMKIDATAALQVIELAEFVRGAWPVIEPGRGLAWNWHIDLICQELESVAHGRTRELVICIPPGGLKSILVSVCFPAWLWLHRPHERVMALSNDEALTLRDGRRMREIVQSQWYQELVRLTCSHRNEPDVWGIAADQNEKRYFATTRQGGRQNLGMGGAVTGKRCDGQIIDDPYDAKAALLGSVDQVRARMAAGLTTYDEVLSSRLEPGGWRVLVMQRLHEHDLAGVLIRRGASCVVLPTEFDPELAERLNDGTWRSLVHPRDPRKKPGELLHKERVPGSEVARRKEALGRSYHAQEGQRPYPAEGGLFPRSAFEQRYNEDPQYLGARCDRIGMSIDCTFQETAGGSFNVAHVWGQVGATKFYLLDELRMRCGYRAWKGALRQFLAKWPQTAEVLIERKANGAALVDDLQGEFPRVIAVDPGTKGKVERAQIASVPVHEAGNCWFPSKQWAPWIDDHIEECCAFPDGANDDRVDVDSQLLGRWTLAKGPTALERTRAQFAGWAH